MARHCPRVSAPITRSDGVEDSGTGIKPPVHGQTGGSTQCACSSDHRRNGSVFTGSVSLPGGRRMVWLVAHNLARLKSFPQGPGHLHAKMCGSACDGFLLSLVRRGRTMIEKDG